MILKGRTNSKTVVGLVIAVFILAAGAIGQNTGTGSVEGRILDPSGAIVPGAMITLRSADGTARTATSDTDAVFKFNNVQPGTYTIEASVTGFDIFRQEQVVVIANTPTRVDVKLSLSVVEEVTVGTDLEPTVDPESNASATVLKEADIEALPDDPEELQAALEALAGPGAGPGGGEIFIDGFSGGALPRRDSIREIRINQNPFSSEYDRLGLGRIQIFTKPGTDDWNGEVEFDFEDESLNSRNPFAPNRPPFQMRNFEFELSGPIVKKRASFYVDVEHQSVENNAVINAIVLDQALNAVPFSQGVSVPTRSFELSPRMDLAVSDTHTISARYFYDTSRRTNAGLGGFNLASRAFETWNSEHTVRLTDTLVLSPTVVTETRFQYIRRRSERTGGSDLPTIRVLDSFTSGGANLGLSLGEDDRLELINSTSVSRGEHALKFGARVRRNSIRDISEGNFAGTFTFTSLDQYRNTLLDLPGAGPTQFSIAGGEPSASVTRTDVGLFFQDDWRVRPDLTVSLGLRYENQTNISSNTDLAPRLAFSWAPGGGSGRPTTVFRGGIGVFYDRFGEGLTLQTARYNGINQQQFLVTDPAILDDISFTLNGVTNIPTVIELTAFAQPQTTRIVSPNLSTPRTIQTVFSIERQLPHRTTLSATFTDTRTRRLLRSRNINAPVGGARPQPGSGNIFQYESTGRFDQRQFTVNFRSNFREGVSIFGNYSLRKANSDSEGAGSFPVDQFDFDGEYGRSLMDIRHNFTMGARFDAFWGIRVNPFVTFRSGVPFNITTGLDNNGDTIFNDRPAFADDPEEPGVVVTRFGAFDPTPEAGDIIIPRNYGRGPSYFNVNLRLAKEFDFGPKGDRDDDGRYSIELAAQIQNIFNITNLGNPVGNLRSSFFGEPVSLAGWFGRGGGSPTAGNRRVRLSVEFNF
jgi:hypothetical protein